MEDLLHSLRAAYSASCPGTIRFESMPITDFQGDGTLLRLALGNLLDNALKYATGGHPITVSVSEQFSVDQPGIAFNVTSAFDGGADEDCEVWFEKFWRGKDSAGKEGVGLGLYLVRSIAEAHGGSARCRLNKEDSGLVPVWLVATLWIPASRDEDHHGNEEKT